MALAAAVCGSPAALAGAGSTPRVVVSFPVAPIELGKKTVVVMLDVRAAHSKLAALSSASHETLFLHLGRVVAARQPGVLWQVYLGATTQTPRAQSPSFVGNLALYGAGIRDEADGHAFTPATFSLPASRALAAALRRGTTKIRLTFLPTGPLIAGKRSVPEPKATVTVGAVSITAERNA